jgi:hypothetical protein
MGIIDRVFSRRAAAPPPASVLSSELTHPDVEKYYARMISDMLRRVMVQAGSVDIRVRRSGAGPDGMPSFAGFVRILRWDPIMPVLLQNIAVIDGRIRKIVEASVILERTHFDGLWFQATSATEGAPQALVGLPAELVRQPSP